MELRDLLPIVVPGALLQVLIQAYYIRHCWRNRELTERQKVLYIAAIAIMNLPAAAFYLLRTRQQDHDRQMADQEIEVDDHTRQGVFVLLVIAYEIFTLRIMNENLRSEHYHGLILLLSANFVIMIGTELLVRRWQRWSFFRLLLPLIQLVLILSVEFLDRQGSAQFAVLITVVSLINALPLSLSRVYAVLSFGGYFVVSLTKAFSLYGAALSDDVFSYIYTNMLIFLLVTAAFYTLKQLQLANARLWVTLRTLNQQAQQLEQLGAVAERNRIAGEIHDTVGHTLTSAVISIEAGEQLLLQDQRLALGQFALAREQIKRGLNDIRSSVRTIRDGGEMALLPAIKQLLGEIEQNTGLAITSVLTVDRALLPVQQSVILRAIKECATNSLRHGHASEVDILLQEHKGEIRLTISDNGQGANAPQFGFGLGNMAERVRGIGGSLQVESAEGEGFTVSILIPIGKDLGGVRK